MLFLISSRKKLSLKDHKLFFEIKSYSPKCINNYYYGATLFPLYMFLLCNRGNIYRETLIPLLLVLLYRNRQLILLIG